MSEEMNEEMDDMNQVDSTDPAAQDQSGEVNPEIEPNETHQEAVDQVLETRDEEMDRLREAANSADGRVLKAQAEAENFRKRLRRDYEDQVKYAPVPLVTDMLEVRDNLLRGLEAANSADAGGLQEGVAMVVKQLDDFLTKRNNNRLGDNY